MAKKYSKLKNDLPQLDIDKNPPKKQAKPIIKKILKITIVLTSLLAINLAVLKGGSYLSAKNNNMLNFTEKTYSLNENIEPGYYNKKPIKVCISDCFGEKAQQKIIDGINYLDEKAIGIKFDCFVGKPNDDNCDIAVYRTKYNSNVISGEATVGNLKGSQIKGDVYLDESFDTMMSLKYLTIHEVCHVIGLSHSKNVNSMMFPIVTTTKLSKQDVENLNTIYPAE